MTRGRRLLTMEDELHDIRLRWQHDLTQLEHLRAKVCTCGHGTMEPAFHDPNGCPVGIGGMT